MQNKATLGVSLLCYNNERVLLNSLLNLQKLDFSPFSSVKIIVFDPGYPLKNKEQFNSVCEQHQCQVFDMTNFGQTQNIKATVPYFKDCDYVLGWEPDADIREPNYLKICVELLKKYEDVGYITPMAEEWVYARQGETRHKTDILECKEITFAGGWPQLFYRGSSFQKLKYIQASCAGPYGGTEMDIFKAMLPEKGLMLRNVRDLVDQSQFDKSYQDWKHATIGRADQKDFKDTL
jgi:hypothetical protein